MPIINWKRKTMMRKRNKFALILLLLIFVLSLSGCNYFRVPSHKLTFYAENGTTILLEGEFRSADLVNIGVIASKIELKEGYEFIGFFGEDGNMFSEKTKLDGDMSFTAKVSPITYKIVYKSIIDFNSTNPTTYTIETETFSLNVPSSTSGYDFVGWTSDKSGKPQKNIEIKKGTIGNLEFTANWQNPDKYYLYFETFGGDGLKPLESDTNNFDISSLTPAKEGYEFKGWFIDENCLIPIANSTYTALNKTSVLYAKWTAIEYEITFFECDLEKIIYTAETEDFTLKSPYRAGYEFVGFVSSDNKSPQKDIIIKKGTIGNLEFTAKWDIKTITISFDSQGGSKVSPIVAKFGESLSEPKAPTKADCQFTGWYLDPLCETKFDFSKNSTMPAESITLYAGWYSSNNYTLSYSSSISGIDIEANRANGSLVTAHEKVSLSVPTVAYGGIFKNWTVSYGYSEQVYSYDSNITFEMTNKNAELCANYEPIEAFTYTIGEQNLKITDGVLDKVFGNGIDKTEYSGQNISGEYLSSLGSGLYVFSYKDTVWKTCVVKVEGRDLLSKVTLDYDLNYPSVTLLFDEADGASYEYSFNSSAYQDCNSGLIISDYDKGRRNEVTVRNKNDYDDKITFVKASNQTNNSYYEKTFSFNGKTCDFVIESREEIIEFVKYFVYVGAFEEENRSPSDKYRYGTASISAYIGDSFTSEFIANQDYYCKYVFDKLGVPYFPHYDYKFNQQTNVLNFSVYFMNDSPNMVATNQMQNLPVNGNSLLVDYSSQNANYKLPNENFVKTQNIRTVYELENLDFGIKPVFDENSDQIAKDVYNSAQTALKKYTNAQMNDFEIVTAIYDYLTSTITYETEVVSKANDSDIGKYSAFSSYGALVKGFAVCDGISSAFNIMCSIMGIESYEITGYSTANGIGGHAWNKVNIYGNWYGVDPTWAYTNIKLVEGQPAQKYVTHRHFLVPEGDLYSQGHVESGYLDESGTTLMDGVVDIVATACMGYYDIELLNGLSYTATSGDKLEKIVAEVSSRGGKCVEVAFDGTPQEFTSFVKYVNRITGKYKITGTSFLFTNANGSKVYMIYFS